MNKIKLTITIVAAVLVVVLAIGLCLQFLGSDKVKPSNWLNSNKSNSVKLEKIEVGQKIDGIKFDTSKNPDLSKFRLDDGMIELLEVGDDYAWGRDILYVVDLTYMFDDFYEEMDEIPEPCLALMCNETIIVYCERDLEIPFMNMFVKKGWNNSLLKDGVLKFSNLDSRYTYFSVREINFGSAWNGVFAGASLADYNPNEKLCYHRSTNNGVCDYCGVVVEPRIMKFKGIKNFSYYVYINSSTDFLNKLDFVFETNSGEDITIKGNQMTFDDVDLGTIGYNSVYYTVEDSTYGYYRNWFKFYVVSHSFDSSSNITYTLTLNDEWGVGDKPERPYYLPESDDYTKLAKLEIKSTLDKTLTLQLFTVRGVAPKLYDENGNALNLIRDDHAPYFYYQFKMDGSSTKVFYVALSEPDDLLDYIGLVSSH